LRHALPPECSVRCTRARAASRIALIFPSAEAASRLRARVTSDRARTIANAQTKRLSAIGDAYARQPSIVISSRGTAAAADIEEAMPIRPIAPALLSIAISGCVEGTISEIDDVDAATFTPAAAPEVGVAQPDALPDVPVAVAPSKIEYAPYFYSWAWESSLYSPWSLVEMLHLTGTRGATLGFVVSQTGACEASREIQNEKGDIAAFVAAGGKVTASFGGYDEMYLEEACPDATSLEKAIAAFVDETGLTDLDFDLEKADALTAEMNARRSVALRHLQATRPIEVTFTLPSNPRANDGTPGGVKPAGLAVLQSAIAAGVKIKRVNLLTMDFGPTFSTGRAMGDLAVSALTDAAEQLKVLYPGLDDAAAYRMLGATPMIGQNDKPSEIFSVDDVAILVAFAKQKKLGFLSFWAIQRDQPTCTTSGLASCSQAQSSPFEFSHAFLSRL
jgi:hypothetical protein